MQNDGNFVVRPPISGFERNSLASRVGRVMLCCELDTLPLMCVVMCGGDMAQKERR